MSESKHTPGPWQVCGTRHTGDLKIGRDARLHMVGPDGDAVAAVFFDMKTGRGFRDARLIAAAPELLQALKGLLADIEDYQRINNLGGENNHWQVISRAAIAKAEGR